LTLEAETQIPLVNPLTNEQQWKLDEDGTAHFRQSSNEIHSATPNKNQNYNSNNEIKQGDGTVLIQSKDNPQNQEEEDNESEIPLSAILTSTDQKCVVCNKSLCNLSYLVCALGVSGRLLFL
jgi:hypothetical protein